MEYTKLIVLIGACGSGKTSWAKREERISECNGDLAVRISKEDISIHPYDYPCLKFLDEVQVCIDAGAPVVIVDSDDNITKKSRMSFVMALSSNPYVNLYFYYFPKRYGRYTEVTLPSREELSLYLRKFHDVKVLCFSEDDKNRPILGYSYNPETGNVNIKSRGI